MRYAGEPLDLPTRVPKIKARPLVLICDISGSMERYTRRRLHFMHTLAASINQVESFVFSTRLTRLTRTIRHQSIDMTLKEASSSVKDWAVPHREYELHWLPPVRWDKGAEGDRQTHGDPCTR